MSFLQYVQKTLACMLLGLLLMSGAFAQTKATEAGTVLLSLGDVKVLREGKSLPLARGASIQAGDSISTGVASNAQIRMTDGAVIAIRAQSEFKINEYQFQGKGGGNDKASVSLLKGGVRAVTGSIGKDNPDNLKVNAVVATVGIRGTGFNINYCDGDCVNKDKSPVKDGLYAGVFEGKIVVTNQSGEATLGVNQYLYVADKDSAPVRLRTAPNFLPDPLTGQKSAKPKSGGTQAADIPTLNAPVSGAPSKPADSQVQAAPSPTPSVVGISINQPPALAATNSPFILGTVYNLSGQGNGIAPANPSNPYSYYLQVAETNPSSMGTDGLPYHNILPASNPISNGVVLNQMQLTTAGSGLATYVAQISLPSGYVVKDTNIPVNYQIGSLPGAAQQLDGGNYNGIISWGRWANGQILQIAGYNPTSNSTAGPVSMPANNGFNYIVGERTTQSNLENIKTNLSFSLLGATTPTYVQSAPGSWSVTSGTFNANFANSTPSISGNMGLYNSQPAGYGFYNMTINGSLSPAAAYNVVTTNVNLVSGSLATCSGGCPGAGNITFYGNAQATGTAGANAAGLSYNFNTGSNVIQGVAVFKR